MALYIKDSTIDDKDSKGQQKKYNYGPFENWAELESLAEDKAIQETSDDSHMDAMKISYLDAWLTIETAEGPFSKKTTRILTDAGTELGIPPNAMPPKPVPEP